MAKKAKPKRKTKKVSWLERQRLRIRKWAIRGLSGLAGVFVLAVLLFAIVNPPTTWTIYSESQRLGSVKRDWVDADNVAPVFLRSVVAAEDANFCTHWGFDMAAIREAIDGGAARGASTLTQQTVKNVYLWQGRSWLRKAIEAVTTPVVELIWSKRRILEVYVNVAEFDEGVFGVRAAAQHYFGVTPARLNAAQSARLAAVLPNPKQRSASRPSSSLVRRGAQIMDGAATIERDGRADCFE